MKTTVETAALDSAGFDEERFVFDTFAASLADSLPSFESQAEAIADVRNRVRLPLGWLASAKDGVALMAKIAWAAPWSLWGVFWGVLGLLTGGGVQRSGRIIEFWGGCLPLFLKYFPFVAGSPVATFGHVVLGRTWRHLEPCRPHQMIHVRQYECWGPLFVPVYLICGAVMWCIGKRPYYDNPFEREAYDATSDW